jgi:hypothetical protein
MSSASHATTGHDAEPALLDIYRRFGSLTDMTNAIDAAIKAMMFGETDLEYMSTLLTRSLEAKDFQGATFAFEVLNLQCGNALPLPLFMRLDDPHWSKVRDAPSQIPLDYQEQLELAADLLRATKTLTAKLNMQTDMLRCAAANLTQDDAKIYAAMCAIYYNERDHKHTR